MEQPEWAWVNPPADLALPAAEIHLWRTLLDRPAAEVERLAQVLSADEQARAGRFHFERDRARFVVGRATLRAILGRYLGVEPGRLRFIYNAHGKPAPWPAWRPVPWTDRQGGLAEPHFAGGGPLSFSLSHSHRLALYAIISAGQVGVDVEWVRPVADLERIVEQFFSATENATFRGLPPEQKLEAFYNGWTRKEALLKARGDGLAGSLDQFSVSLAPGEPARLLSVDGDVCAASGWSVWALQPAQGYVAALAARGPEGTPPGWRLRCWECIFAERRGNPCGCPPGAGTSPAPPARPPGRATPGDWEDARRVLKRSWI